MFRRYIILVISLLWPILLVAQAIPTSYEAAKKIGDAKLSVLQKTNVPALAHYVVLNKGWGWRFNKLLKYENTIYVIDKNYNLYGKTIDVPANSVIVLRKGNIRNGTLLGNNAKYSVINSKSIKCQLSGTWQRIAPIYKASELGLKNEDKNALEFNYAKLEEAIRMGYNIFLDGVYYVSFSKPLLLDYQLHLFGGKLYFSRHAFDLTDGGGVFADGVHFSSIVSSHTDDIVCGTREKHSAITTESIEFFNCHFSCNRVLSLEFVYTNPEETPFGIKSLIVKNCYADNTAKFITLDVSFIEKCIFKNNTFTNFSHAPIYICPNHSKRVNPDEIDANPWAEEMIITSCDIIIDSNIFWGKEVSEYTYYCAALVEGKKCLFTNNYLKDIINYSDNNSKGMTAYDAYLSCVDVVYEDNYVENMMSYAKDGVTKPQTEIGKSKLNPLASFSQKAKRRYVNNIFICDGSEFKKKGADESSLTCNIFHNVSPIDSYIWTGNAVIYKGVVLCGRTSSAKYGRFDLKDNYFECSRISGNLVFLNSAYDISDVTITGNVIKTEDSSRFIIFNQLYNEEYRRFSHGNISITDNEFVNSSPIYFYFVADTVRVRNNKTQELTLDGNLYLSDYTGKSHSLEVRSLDADMPLVATNPQGAVAQFFSDESIGTFSIRFKSIPKRGVNYHYLTGGTHDFKIVFYHNGAEEEVVFENDGNGFYYTYGGECKPIQFSQTGTKVWYKGDGIVFSSSFHKGSNNDIQTSLTVEEGVSEGDYKLTYISL